MILTLQIDKLRAGQYSAVMTCQGHEVTDPELYSCIEDAIRDEVLSIPVGFAHFIEVRYSGFSSGTLIVAEVPGLASSIATKLIALAYEHHLLVEGVFDR